MALNLVHQKHFDGALAVCRRKTSEVSNDIFAGTVTKIIRPL